MFVDATSILYQLQNVVQRNNTALWRSPDYVFTRLFVHALIPLCISLSFLNLGNSVRDLQYRVFAMWVYHLYVKGFRLTKGIMVVSSFWIIILPAIISNSSLLCRDGLTIVFSSFSGADWADVHIQQKFVCFMLVHLVRRLWFTSYARGFHSRFGTRPEDQKSLYWLTHTTESSSRIYSPYVFAVGQLIGEIPYSVLCAILYWVLTVCNGVVRGAIPLTVVYRCIL